MFFFAFFVQVFLRLPCVSVRRKTNQNEYELKKQINVKNNNNNNINTIRKKILPVSPTIAYKYPCYLDF